MPTQRQQIVHILRQEILAGKYAPGVPMPGEHAFCERFQVSRGTLRLALADLEHGRLIYKQHGRGTFVHPPNEVMPQPVGFLLLEPQKATTVGMMALLNGAGAYLGPIGSHVTLLCSPPEQWHPTLCEALAGVMVVPTCVTNAHLETLERLNIPAMLMIDNEFPGTSVHFGMEETASALVEGLLELGHRRFALISGHDENVDRLRKRGIARTLNAAGIPFDQVTDFRTNYDPANAWEAAQQVLALHPRPTAVIAFDDTLALQMIRAAFEHGLRVPQDISVVGSNDAPHAALTVPAISTVRVPMLEAGQMAAEALCRATLKEEALPNITLQSEICWRESTGPAPKDAL